MRCFDIGGKVGPFLGESQRYIIFGKTIMPEHPLESPVIRIPPSKKAGEFQLTYGPLAGGMLESVTLKFITPGEIIRGVGVEDKFKAREIKVSGRTIQDAILMIERLNGFHAASHSIAFSMAVEEAIGINVPEEILKARMAMLELERIRSHLHVVASLAEADSFAVPSKRLSYLSEKVTRLISQVSGHRYFFGSIFPGGVFFSNGDKLNGLSSIGEEFNSIYDGLLSSKIFLSRLKGNGILQGEKIIGPAGRAAGISNDARLHSGCLSFGKTGLREITYADGDAYARFRVRSDEILESIRVIENLDLPAEIEGKQREVFFEELSKGAAIVESPSGPIFYYVEVKDGLIHSIDYSFPSPFNISYFARSMKGKVFTDFQFNWESYGIWISESSAVIS